MEKLLHSNGNQKKAGEVRHMSDKTEFKNKDYYRTQGRTLHTYQGINPRRIYNNCKYIYSQYRSTSTVADFNISLTTMDRLSRQKISNETQGLNETLEQIK